MNVDRPKVLGAGLVALDVVVSADPTKPLRTWAGGTCGNVISILAAHDWDAYPIARMNNDSAALRVKQDLEQWGVKLDLTSSGPSSHTPIVVQEIKRSAAGEPIHKFSWSCPHCGRWLPSFKPITQEAVDIAAPFLPGTAVFFMDRVSRGTLTLATAAAEAGAVVMFEPSGRGDPKLFAEAIEAAHIIKYSDQRIADLALEAAAENMVLEVQTLGPAGLRYRTPRLAKNAPWQTVKAQQAQSIVDSCGSGDWCTAGILTRLARKGLSQLQEATPADLLAALEYGQSLAAWNCGFEGARGGMYNSAGKMGEPTTQFFSRILEGHAATNPSPSVECPRCDVA